MPSDQTRAMVWHGLLEISRGERYFGTLAARYRRRAVLVRIVLGLAATGVLVSLLAALPNEVGIGISIAIAGVAITDLALDFSRRSALLDMMSRDLSLLGSEYRKLWEDTYAARVDDAEALRQLRTLSPRLQAVTGRLILGTDDKLNKRCAEAAYKVEKDRYAA